MNITRINPKELSSRKLWQLAETPAADQLSLDELSEIIEELRERCHDLNDLQKISNEIEKLEIILGRGATITPESIEDNIGISKDFNNFELQKALSIKDTFKACLRGGQTRYTPVRTGSFKRRTRYMTSHKGSSERSMKNRHSARDFPSGGRGTGPCAWAHPRGHRGLAALTGLLERRTR